MLISDKNTIALSVNPTYHCNLRCSFCYLTEAQLSDRKRLDIEVLNKRLLELKAQGYSIGTVDLYGGEVTLLEKEYLFELYDVLHSHGAKDVEIITNLTSYRPEIVEDPRFGISVSYDFQHRPQHEHVWKNMLKLNRDFTILTLGIPQIIQGDVKEFVEQVNLLDRCKNWEIKPYSPNQANQIPTSYVDFEEFVKKIILYENKKFRFLNELAVDASAKGLNNSYSDDHVYITPSGNFGVLEFDKDDNEFFLELDSFSKYIDWTFEEKNRTFMNEHCSTCSHLGGCLSEHLRPVQNLDDSCNGFIRLIEWHKGRIGV